MTSEDDLRYQGVPVGLAEEAQIIQALARRPVWVRYAVYGDGRVQFLDAGALDSSTPPHDNELELPADFLAGVHKRISKGQKKEPRPEYMG